MSGQSGVQCAAYLICRFLDDQQDCVDDQIRESIAVARECIASSFNLNESAEKSASEMIGNATLLSLVESLSAVKDKVNDLKTKGNDLMKSEKFNEAADCYSEAIKLAPNNAILYCNRAAARCRLSQFEEAVSDCRAAIGFDPNYAKAWGRLATALSALGSHIEAAEAFQRAAEIEPDIPAWKEGIDKERAAVSGSAASGSATGASPFGASPNFLMNLMQSPHMMQMAQQMMSDPNMTRMMQNVMGGGLGGSGAPPNMDAIMSMAQNFAQQMESQNPELINRLRNQYGQGGQPPQGPPM